jgi:hypothetical protein
MMRAFEVPPARPITPRAPMAKKDNELDGH